MTYQPDYRDSLANERTYLAYIRTALAVMVAGAALLHLDGAIGTTRQTFVFGIALIVTGAALSLAGYGRYHSNRRAIQSGEYLHQTRLPLMFAIGIAAIAVVVVALAIFG